MAVILLQMLLLRNQSNPRKNIKIKNLEGEVNQYLRIDMFKGMLIRVSIRRDNWI